MQHFTSTDYPRTVIYSQLQQSNYYGMEGKMWLKGCLGVNQLPKLKCILDARVGSCKCPVDSCVLLSQTTISNITYAQQFTMLINPEMSQKKFTQENYAAFHLQRLFKNCDEFLVTTVQLLSMGRKDVVGRTPRCEPTSEIKMST